MLTAFPVLNMHEKTWRCSCWKLVQVMVHFRFSNVIFQLYCMHTCCPSQKYCHHQWRRMCVFWIKNSGLSDNHGPQCLFTIQPYCLDSPGRKRVRIRAMLIQLGWRQLLANFQSQEKIMDEIGLRQQNNVESDTVFTTTSQLELLHLMERLCSELTENRTTAGRGEADSVFKTSMLGAQTQSKLMTVFLRCHTFDEKMQTTLSSPSCCCCLHSPCRFKGALYVYV